MRVIIATAMLCLLAFPAHARYIHHYAGHHFKHHKFHHDGLWRHRSFAHHRHVRYTAVQTYHDGRWGAQSDQTSPDSRWHSRRIRAASAGDGGGTQMVGHPVGCPSRAFCGCGAAVRLFGSPIRSLWLAANWLRFPAASPGPGMAVVRSHHVMVILAYHGNGRATVYDANSGHHQTRIHERSLAGYRIVNPRAG